MTRLFQPRDKNVEPKEESQVLPVQLRAERHRLQPTIIKLARVRSRKKVAMEEAEPRLRVTKLEEEAEGPEGPPEMVQQDQDEPEAMVIMDRAERAPEQLRAEPEPI